MDWTTIITSALAVIFGGGWFATWRAQRREDNKASNEEWQSLYNETRARNADLEHKIDELRSENVDGECVTNKTGVFLPDGLHPNPAGHKLMFEALVASLPDIVNI